MLPRIFIGGTGRSGTTILYKVLGSHEAVHSFPSEMRFIVDPDGLINLLDSLTVRYSPVQAREALFRFERLMRLDLNTPSRAPFITFNISKLLGEEHYWNTLDQFCSALVDFEYTVSPEKQPKPYRDGRAAAVIRYFQNVCQKLLREPAVTYRTTFNWPLSRVKQVKYFCDRRELVALTAAFIDDLFLYAARHNGKETWCEKTPQNIFHIDFLKEIFPESVFIHITRDPRGVVLSTINQAWGPVTLPDTCHFLRSMYERWFWIKDMIDLNKYRYMELKLEDLAQSPQDELEKLASICGLKNDFPFLPKIEQDRVDYWKYKMSPQEIEVVNSFLGPYITRLGYDV